MNVQEYIRADGSCPYQQWFDGLDVESAVKVTTAKLRMEQGNLSSVKWFEGIGEYKIDWGPGYRIYLLKDGDELIVLFGGGTKNTQSVDIKRAKILMEEYKKRKREEAIRNKEAQKMEAKESKRVKKGKSKR